MRKLFSSAPRRGLYVNPRVWRGPKTVLSDHIRERGVDIKALGVRDTGHLFNSVPSKVIVIITTL
jgi:hypothetical protein